MTELHMELGDMQTGDVFKTSGGCEFIRTGAGVWSDNNVISLPNLVPGKMDPWTVVEPVGKMRVERRALSVELGAYGKARCHHCNKMIPVDTEEEADALASLKLPCSKCRDKDPIDKAMKSYHERRKMLEPCQRCVAEESAQVNRERIRDSQS